MWSHAAIIYDQNYIKIYKLVRISQSCSRI